MQALIRLLMLGDVSGESGLKALERGLPSFRSQCSVDFVICNGENASNGFGLGIEEYNRIKESGVDVITSGNHIWENSEGLELLKTHGDILRPLNYSASAPGRGCYRTTINGKPLAVINLQGRINMPPIDDPFAKVEDALRELEGVNLIFIDFHAEEPMEKEALSYYLDGRVTSLCGTHTHVQTADEKILPKGTAYITDLGLTGALREVIGGRPESAIERQTTQLPVKAEPSSKPGNIQGALIEADLESGRALSIKRVTI